MSDDRLRALQRRWRESGAVEDEAAWVAASVRAGVELERFLLAALTGHEAARLAIVGVRRRPLPAPPEDPVELIERLQDFECCDGVKAAAIVAREALPRWERHLKPDARAAARVAAEWLATPTREVARRADELAHACWQRQDRSRPSVQAHRVAAWVAATVAATASPLFARRSVAESAASAARLALGRGQQEDPWPPPSHVLVEPGELLRVLRVELAAWALGEERAARR